MRKSPFAPSIRSAAVAALFAAAGAPAGAALDEVLWERNRDWADAGVTYFDGIRCAADGADSCPREMGWQGSRLAWTFPLPADAARTPSLRFELSIDRVGTPVTVTVRAGPAGGPLVEAGSLRIESAGVHRLPISSEAFRPDVRNEIALAGDNAAGYGEPSGIRWFSAGLYRHEPDPPEVADEDLLDDTEWRACRFFWEQAGTSGLVLDKLGAEESSIAATGFGATAMTILAARWGTAPRWTVAPEEARGRAEMMMDAVLAIQARQASDSDRWGIAGIPYHFVEADGSRDGSSEVSTIDGALLLAGLLQAGEHFGGTVREKARRIFAAVDWKRFYRADRNRYSHGSRPESGLIDTDWDRPGDEALLVCLLALAGDPTDPDRLRACYGYPRVSETYAGVPVVRSYFGSLFTYTFAHFWFPLECLGKDRPAAGGVPSIPAVDWWANSRSAVEASRRYHAARLAAFPGLGADAWGASACFRPDLGYFGTNGAEPCEASGGAAFDGTLPPYGAIMSLFLARTAEDEDLGANPAFRALRAYHEDRFAMLWCSYGPRSSFDPAGNVSPMVVGIEKGPEALGIEAYRSGFTTRSLLSNPSIAAALALVFERSACPPAPGPFLRGEANGDGAIDLSDGVFILSNLFAGGRAPSCPDAADANDDGGIDVSDPIAVFSFLFLGMSRIPPPFPIPGFDPTPDGIGPCLGR
jgi:hypothetical protein